MFCNVFTEGAPRTIRIFKHKSIESYLSEVKEQILENQGFEIKDTGALSILDIDKPIASMNM